MLKTNRLGFIGGGFMAEALIKGLLDSGASAVENITVSELRTDRREYLAESYGISTINDNVRVADDCDILILAVKPYDVVGVAESIRGVVSDDQLIISIAAGVKIATLADGLSAKIVRAMPNTAARVGQAVTALSFNPHVTDDDKELARQVFAAVGTAVFVEESQMDAVTGLSGSGPAYIFLVMESMIQAGVEAGLSLDQSRSFTYQTVKGAAELAIKTGEHPAALREMITSPKGTTAAGLHELERGKVRAAFLDAIASATARSKELG